jgi:hypothetical protein
MHSRQFDPVTLDSGSVALAFHALHEPGSRYPFLDRLLPRRRMGRTRVGGVIIGRTEPEPQHFVVVRRGQTKLFNRLQREFADVPRVRVIWDRRMRDRRGSRDSMPGTERRQRNRRGRPPAIWEVQGYLLV